MFLHFQKKKKQQQKNKTKNKAASQKLDQATAENKDVLFNHESSGDVRVF